MLTCPWTGIFPLGMHFGLSIAVLLLVTTIVWERAYSNCQEGLALRCWKVLFEERKNWHSMSGLAGILQWVKLIDNFEAEYEYVTNEGTVFTFKTNRHSPNYQLINIDFSDPEETKWKVLVPEHEKDVLGKSSCQVKDLLFCFFQINSVISLLDDLLQTFLLFSCV